MTMHAPRRCRSTSSSPWACRKAPLAEHRRCAFPISGQLAKSWRCGFGSRLRATASAGKPGTKLCLYGQDRLADAQRVGHVVLVEGESDCHTLWYHGIPALGLPGAGNWREDRDAGHLDGIETIYVVIEPDRGGEAVRQWLAQSKIRDRVKLIHLPTKDPSALYLEDRHQFPQRWKAACQQAIPWADLDGETNAEGRSEKPRLLVEPCDPDRTVSALRDIIAKAGTLYDRGVPVRLAHDKTLRGTVAHPMTPDALVLMAHRICRPRIVKKGEEVDARLPRNVAVMYLDWRGEWQLPPLNGIASAPMLREDGTIGSAQGYDITTGMWLENVPDMAFLVPERPTDEDARSALHYIRETFKTFCFADAETMLDPNSGVAVVNTAKPPGKDESAFLTALLTAVCRPSLHLAPGLLLRGAPISGAGAGKGLLARCICIIAFGREPHAVTGGGTPEELEKRIAAELIEGSPALFLDNMNNVTLEIGHSRQRHHRTSRPGPAAWQVPDGAAERVGNGDLDGEWVDGVGGLGAPLHRGRSRSRYRGSGGKAVHDRHSHRGDQEPRSAC